MQEITDIGIFLDTETYPGITKLYRANPGDAGFDIKSAENKVIFKGSRCMIHTGVYLKLPYGWECQVRPRSGLALKEGITVLNSPGTIDYSYSGEVCVLLQNLSENVFNVNFGDRIAQLVFKRVPEINLVYLDEKPSNDIRGDGGFGSTGK